ncbi:MAG: UDP-N-acetylmuramate--L-alanine ligase [Saprospiraceae bacterium]|nr:UDP-N-acetylmuramate--L-alanine ligase [Saprospiraceae bacterium]
MKLDKWKYVHFIGIGGIGMSGLAKYFVKAGVRVSGYDRVSTEITRQLEKKGVYVYHEDKVQYAFGVPDAVIYTPAVPNDHIEFSEVVKRHLPCYKRAEVLGKIAERYKTIAIAGTHGKTTTTAMIVSILADLEIGFTGFIGGVLSDMDTNFFQSSGDWLVTEADEFDRSFLTLSPEIAVINSMDADHLDIYETPEGLKKNYRRFAANVKPGGKLILHSAVRNELKLDKEFSRELSIRTFGNEEEADFRLMKIKPEDGHTIMHWRYKGQDLVSQLQMPGQHNAMNALAAMAVGIEMGLQDINVAKAISGFKGIRRRFEKRFDDGQIVIIDDYAHHPTELEATIGAARWMYPERRIVGVFQAHLYSRTRDFMREFGRVLESLDVLYSCELYPAREEPIEGITGRALFDSVDMEEKFFYTRNELAQSMDFRSGDVILIMGAGNIDSIIPELINRIEAA